MGKLLAVIEREFGERVRSKWFLVSTLFAPLLFAALFIGPPYLAYKSSRSVDFSSMVIVDGSGTTMGDGIATELAGGLMATGQRATVIAVTATDSGKVLDSLRTRLGSNALPAVAVIDANTLAVGTMRLLLAGGAPIVTSERVQAAAERELLRRRVADAGIDLEQAQRIAKLRITATVERVMRDGRSGSAQVNLLFGAGVALLLYLIIVLYGQIVLRGVTEEKQSRVSELVLASVSPRVLLTGKVLGIGGVALVQLGFWTASAVTLLANRGRLLGALGVTSTSITLPAFTLFELAPLLAYFVFGYILYAALFAAVGSIVSSEQEAQQAQTPLVSLLVGSMALLQPALSDPDGPIARTMSIVPFSSPILMPLRLGLASVPASELVLSIVLLVISALAAMVAAARLYRTALLMYGKRPSIGEIIRWIRVNG
ncbi:MAG: ABC transporter permease [Gemmatimonas sp.]|uniref:ABC transporter permease n=1 Tax=Gemmatimonas sp. TaxID=1962908 RepID=UPI0025BC2736|nr:ABC transporter permease [Gemmatimonas sp.]MCA2989112.1 ABC transporter permease [Gemmatimonas sp.]